MKKTILLLIVIFTTVLVIVYFFINQSRDKRPKVPETSPQAQPTSSIDSFGQLTFPSPPEQSLSYSLSVPQKQFPDSLPRYSIQKIQIGEAAQHYSASSGLGRPRELRDVGGTVYLWESGDASITLSQNPFLFRFIRDSEATKIFSGLSEEQIKDAAIQQIQEKIKPPSTPVTTLITSISYTSEQSLNPAGLGSPDGATIAEAAIEYSLDGYPLVPFQGTAGRVLLNANLQAIKISMNWYPNIKKEADVTTIISYKEAVARLQSGAAALVSYQTANKSQKGFEPIKIQSTMITEADLGYYYSPTADSLVPVYKFTGLAPNKAGAGQVTTITLVSALP